ncbi:MAG: hypothetical protein KY469_16475 [Actinobacteria bacterium]|nr:hypothetical protein [Actinomycetota bacterium]
MRDELWPRRAVIAVTLGAGLCFAILLVAWYGGAGEASLKAQVVWLNLGAAAVIAASVLAVAFLRQARFRISQRRRELLAELGLTPLTDADHEVDAPSGTEP